MDLLIKLLEEKLQATKQLNNVPVTYGRLLDLIKESQQEYNKIFTEDIKWTDPDLVEDPDEIYDKTGDDLN